MRSALLGLMSSQTLPPIEAKAEEPQVQAPKERGSVLEIFERLGTVVVPVAVGLYALLYLGFQSVYDTFGITPEQAGIDQSTLLGRLIATLILLFLILLPLAGMVVGVGWLLNVITRGWAGRMLDRGRERPWLAATVGALLSGVAYWGLLTMLGVTGTPVLVTIAVVALFGYLIPYRLLRRQPSGRAGMRVLISALVGIGMGFVLVGWMTEGAEDVYKNGDSNIVLMLAGFPNQWAAVSDGDGKVLTPDDRWLVLGQDGGSYTFYDCGKMATVRRPIEATILTNIVLDPDFSEGGTEKVEDCGYANK
ncbi:hypothetical protein GCM10012278_03730 [Nonomuraea glycinis]|uniref:Uncharacterized protein n=2 Tax=Nonomuraea glycinis TaxID=2047744 RepID=A0A917ZYL8_9ACTN|nr:hypothetical protein GCM10012278_03730 [Nonomuraea glycinis]